MAAYILPSFLSAVRAMAARCKLPFAFRPGLSQEDKVRCSLRCAVRAFGYAGKVENTVLWKPRKR